VQVGVIYENGGVVSSARRARAGNLPHDIRQI
jgi:hypothetical protein